MLVCLAGLASEYRHTLSSCCFPIPNTPFRHKNLCIPVFERRETIFLKCSFSFFFTLHYSPRQRFFHLTFAAIFSSLDMQGTSRNFQERTQNIDVAKGRFKREINICRKRRWKLNSMRDKRCQHSNISAIRNKRIIPHFTFSMHRRRNYKRG